MSSERCVRCGLYLGVTIIRDSRCGGFWADGQPSDRVVQALIEQIEPMLHTTHLVHAYLQPVHAAPMSPNPLIRCSGAGSGKALGTCGNVLSSTSALLSKQHRWNAGRGNEPAWYVNHVQQGAVTVHTPREMMLAQGPFGFFRV
uniref:Uncharacterized protein n=1 Tax=Prymnesium polylepis TaxID=72548 RepID=A0A7S4HSR5_9EUKA